jgi:hypothetical protein
LPSANARLLGSEAATQVAGPGLGSLLIQIGGAVNAVLVDVGSSSSPPPVCSRSAPPSRGRCGDVLEGFKFRTPPVTRRYAPDKIQPWLAT